MSKKIYLKATNESDFEEYYKVRSDSTDIYWNGYIKAPEKDCFRELFKRRTAFSRFEQPEDRRNYLIKKCNTGDTVGFVQLIRRKQTIEIGYSVLKEYQGKGYATEALYQGVKLARKYKLPVIVTIRDDNLASQCVAKKNGFIRTDTFIEREYPEVGVIKLRQYSYCNQKLDNLF